MPVEYVRERQNVCGKTKSRKALYGEKYQFSGFNGIQKNWKLAVVIYRSSTKETWDGIRDGLCRRLGRIVDLSTLHANRAILWCRDEKEVRDLTSFESCKVNNVKPVKVVQWSHQQHWEDIVFQGQNICVGIEGIPLNWWNIHALKVIGAKLGGILEIVKETMDRSFLTYAKIRVPGFTNRFLPSVLEMPWGLDFVMLGILPLNNGGGSSLGSAFRRGEALRRSLADFKLQSHEFLHGLGKEAINGDVPLAIGGKSSTKSSFEAIKRKISHGEASTDIAVGELADEALQQDKTSSKKSSMVNSASSDKNRTQKGARNIEALFCRIIRLCQKERRADYVWIRLSNHPGRYRLG